jgi:hypothetical protein
MTSTLNGLSPVLAATTLFDDALTNEGLLQPNGRTNRALLRERLVKFLRGRIVTSRNDRDGKAANKGDLVREIFPTFSDSLAELRDNDPQLADTVWKKLADLLWQEASTGAQSAVQKLVERKLGTGYMVCRAKVGTGNLDSVYITSDWDCIRRDFLLLDNAKVMRQMTRSIANQVTLISQRPEEAELISRLYNAALESIALDAHKRLAIAAASAADISDDGES